jgi:heme/copper-type cytochrome/quinol oxidase subunit 2
MTINWGALLLVAGVSLAVTVVVVALVAFAMVGFSARENGTAAQGALSPAAGTAVGYACIVVVGLIVLFGLAIVSKDVLSHLFG